MALTTNTDQNGKIQFFWNNILLKCSCSDKGIQEIKQEFYKDKIEIFEKEMIDLVNFEVFFHLNPKFPTPYNNPVPNMLDVHDKQVILNLFRK